MHMQMCAYTLLWPHFNRACSPEQRRVCVQAATIFVIPMITPTVYSRTPSLRLVSAPASIRISATPGWPPMAQQCSAETLSDRLCRGKRGV